MFQKVCKEMGQWAHAAAFFKVELPKVAVKVVEKFKNELEAHRNLEDPEQREKVCPLVILIKKPATL